LKTRVVIWTIVVIAVLIGVVVIATGKKPASAPQVTLEAIRKEAAEAETQLNRLADRAVEARKVVAAGDTLEDSLQVADKLLALAREKLEQLRASEELKRAEQLLTECRQHLRSARRAIEVATGPKSRRF